MNSDEEVSSASTTEISAFSSQEEEHFGDPYSFSTTLTDSNSQTAVVFQNPELFNPKYAHKIGQLAAEFLHEIESENNWAQPRLIDQPGRLEVATSTLPYAPFCFRVEADLKGSAEAAFALMHDLSRRPEWDDMCDGLRVIEQLDPFTFIYHIKLKSRWPTSARDSCNLIGFRKLADGRFISIAQSLEDDARCPVDASGKIVRMSTRLSGNLFTPLSDGHFHLTQLIDADPKGFIPSALVQRVSSKSFPLTMDRIEGAIKGSSSEGYYENIVNSAQNADSIQESSHDPIEQALKRMEALANALNSPPKGDSDVCGKVMKWAPLALAGLNTLLLIILLRRQQKQ